MKMTMVSILSEEVNPSAIFQRPKSLQGFPKKLWLKSEEVTCSTEMVRSPVVVVVFNYSRW
jgi:hypothetical protein